MCRVWIRVYATAVDLLLVFRVLIVVAKPLTPRRAFAVVVAWFYPTLLESSSIQGTIGKSSCGLAVTDKSCRQIWYWRVWRAIWARSSPAITLDLGYLLVAGTPASAAFTT
jgi:hypothetical protein